MRTLLVLVASALLAAGCAHARRHATATPVPSGPPVIHESFTILPCPPSPQTTVDLEGCAERKILRTDNVIDGETRTVYSLLNPQGRRAFATASRAWLAYRRAVCSAESSRYAGGTLEPVAFAECEVKLNASHLNDLGALEGRLRSP